MAVLWSHKERGNRYEVRSAGRTLRLYTGGAFHSAWHPDHIMTSGVWDLMSLALLHRETPVRKVLVLGVGGGTVIHQLLALVPGVSVTGVEIDPVHIQVARRFFALDDSRVNLIEADARTYLRTCRTRYDAIIDDIFVHASGNDDPVRPFPPTTEWQLTLSRRLRSDGTLVQNHLSRPAANAAAAAWPSTEVHAQVFTTPQYDNRVLALYHEQLLPKVARARCLAIVPPREARRIRFRSSRLR